METYEVLKDCWIDGILYSRSQLIKLTSDQAQKWLDRKCIQIYVKPKKSR